MGTAWGRSGERILSHDACMAALGPRLVLVLVPRALPHRRAGRVKHRAAVGIAHPLGVKARRAFGTERRDLPCLQAVGVDPRLKLQPPRMGRRNHNGKRVKPGVLPLRAGRAGADDEHVRFDERTERMS